MVVADSHIAWLGLGQMGLPMTRNLVKAGARVTGYDISADRLEMAAQDGVTAAASIAEAASGADIIFTILYDGNVVKTVLTEPGGILDNMRPGALIVEMSTISPEASAEFAGLISAKGCRYLRAPVSGSAILAETGAISVFVSGEREDYDLIQPILKGMSQSQDYVGPGEAARVVKLAINMLVGSATSALGEAIRFGEAWEMPRDILIDAINSSIVGSRHYQSRAAGLKSRQYTTSGPVATLLKDFNMVMADAQTRGYQLPIHSFVRDNIVTLVDEGRGGLEASMLAEFPRDDGGASKIGSGAALGSEVLAADDARYAATLSGEADALSAYLSPGLVYTHSRGVSQSKDEYMESFRSGEFVYKSFERESPVVTACGDCAFMEGVIRIKVAVSGEDRLLHNRFLAGWTRETDRQWRLRSWIGVPVGGTL